MSGVPPADTIDKIRPACAPGSVREMMPARERVSEATAAPLAKTTNFIHMRARMSSLISQAMSPFANADLMASQRTECRPSSSPKVKAAIGMRSHKGWRTIYAHWFGASLVYALSSYIANWAILRNVYFTGSLYDLPLAASMGWVSLVGVIGQDTHAQEEKAPASGRHGVWVARLGMIVILSLPILAAWSVFNSGAPARVRNFRLVQAPQVNERIEDQRIAARFAGKNLSLADLR